MNEKIKGNKSRIMALRIMELRIMALCFGTLGMSALYILSCNHYSKVIENVNNIIPLKKTSKPTKIVFSYSSASKQLHLNVSQTYPRFSYGLNLS